MSSDRIGGRYEPEHRKVGGPGVRCNGKCDECSRDTTARRKAKVLNGSLRGLTGMVCSTCMDLRKKEPA